MTETEQQAIRLAEILAGNPGQQGEAVARVWREGSCSWWAELWRLRGPQDPPPPFLVPRHKGNPEPVPGMVRIGMKFAGSRWAARRLARRMRERYEQGLLPEGDLPTAELVE